MTLVHPPQELFYIPLFKLTTVGLIEADLELTAQLFVVHWPRIFCD
ncbi:MAG: hypothetical protein WD648_12015 [Planctomycetaceae bacterium]